MHAGTGNTYIWVSGFEVAPRVRCLVSPENWGEEPPGLTVSSETQKCRRSRCGLVIAPDDEFAGPH
jgi:hypothetical protein